MLLRPPRERPVSGRGEETGDGRSGPGAPVPALLSASRLHWPLGRRGARGRAGRGRRRRREGRRWTGRAAADNAAGRGAVAGAAGPAHEGLRGPAPSGPSAAGPDPTPPPPPPGRAPALPRRRVLSGSAGTQGQLPGGPSGQPRTGRALPAPVLRGQGLSPSGQGRSCRLRRPPGRRVPPGRHELQRSPHRPGEHLQNVRLAAPGFTEVLCQN